MALAMLAGAFVLSLRSTATYATVAEIPVLKEPTVDISELIDDPTGDSTASDEADISEYIEPVLETEDIEPVPNYQEPVYEQAYLSDLTATSEEVVYEEPDIYVEPAEEEWAAPATFEKSGSVLTKEGGVNYFNGRKETWYSQRVLPGGGLDIPGRHVAEDGTIRDEEGYICVAASDLEYGTVVETSLGTGKVYDTGCAPGTTDIYVDW